MYPHNGESPIDLSLFQKCTGVIDIIYNPRKTVLLLQAEKKGIANIGGLYMLVAQAKRAAEIFTEREIPECEIDIITNKISFQMNNIVLIGMPGCGKTTVGRALSELTGKIFYDSDDEFTKNFGTTPAEAIQSLGEERFREMEQQIIAKLGAMNNIILASGGGVVTREENYLPLHQNGMIFFIDRELKNLPISNRPLSQSTGVDALYNKRYPLYMSFCDHKIVSDEDVKHTATKIYNMFKAEFEQ
jgi:shikimate dehydrogenase